MADYKSEVDGRVGRIGFWLLLGLMLWLVWQYGFNAVWYGTKNGVSADRTYVETKPTDCDFDHAPLGYKGCHYEERDWYEGTGSNKSLYVQWAKVNGD